MNGIDVNKLRDEMLIRLNESTIKKHNPVDVKDLAKEIYPNIDWEDHWGIANDAGKLLIDGGLARRSFDTEKPGAWFLYLTAQGKSKASELILTRSPKSRLKRTKEYIIENWIHILVMTSTVILSAAAVITLIRMD